MRPVLGLLLATVGVLVLAGPARGDTRPVPHVDRAGGWPVIADERGRQLLLRGVNVNGLIEYADDFPEAVPLRRDDFREMAALGFNFLRLPISWSRVAPGPGRLDERYLDEIARVVGWAEDEGLRVLVDFHQDRYNRHTWPGEEVDGAPDWATKTDGAPCVPVALSTLCAQVAYENFWNDAVVAGMGLQAHYLDALLAVSRRLRGDRRLLGIELFNEPTPGLMPPLVFERRQLHPFYRRMIDGLRRDGERRLIWFEPSIFRDITDFDSGLPARFSSDPNLVYGPHIYTEVFSPPGEPTTAFRERLRASFAAAEMEAARYGVPWVDGEWGGGSGGRWEDWRAYKLDLHDEFRVGGAFWKWKQQPGFYDWHTVEVDGSLRTDSLRAQQLSRPHVDSVPGELEEVRLDEGRLRVRVHVRSRGEARLWGGTVVRRGGPTLLERPLTRVLVDGRGARTRIERRRYVSETVELVGYRVDITLPRGTHTVDLLSGRQ